MNMEMLKSMLFKILPVIVTYLVGKGILAEDAAANIPTAVDAIIILAVTVPTIIRSIKTHRAANK
jgi:hypothetical protein